MSSIEEDRGEWERGLPPDRTHVPQVTPHGFHWHRRKTEREWRHDLREARRAALEEAEALLRRRSEEESAESDRLEALGPDHAEGADRSFFRSVALSDAADEICVLRKRDE